MTNHEEQIIVIDANVSLGPLTWDSKETVSLTSLIEQDQEDNYNLVTDMDFENDQAYESIRAGISGGATVLLIGYGLYNLGMIMADYHTGNFGSIGDDLARAIAGFALASSTLDSFGYRLSKAQLADDLNDFANTAEAANYSIAK